DARSLGPEATHGRRSLSWDGQVHGNAVRCARRRPDPTADLHRSRASRYASADDFLRAARAGAARPADTGLRATDVQPAGCARPTPYADPPGAAPASAVRGR